MSTTDKNPKWMMDAAREVCEALGLIGLEGLIIPAIAKHCPEDKGVGKLVEALTECVSWMQATNYMAKNLNPDFGGKELKQYEATLTIINRAQAAIAEYEGDTRYTATEEKRVRILLNTLKFNQDCRHPGLGLCASCRESIKIALAEYEELNK